MGPTAANLLLFFLTFSTGLFVSATSLLPSSFAMYMLAGAASSVLDGQAGRTIVFAVACVTWGWPVAGQYALLSPATQHERALASRRSLACNHVGRNPVLLRLMMA